MAFSMDRPRYSPRRLEFEEYTHSGMTGNEFGKPTTFPVDDVCMDDWPPASSPSVKQGVSHRLVRPGNNGGMVIDLTGDDDIVDDTVEDNMINFTSADLSSSTALAIQQTASLNISSIMNRFVSDSSLVEALQRMDMDLPNATDRRTNATSPNQPTADSDVEIYNTPEVSFITQREIRSLTNNTALIGTRSFSSIIDLSSEKPGSPNKISPRKNVGEVRNVPEKEPYTHVMNGIVYKPGMCIEFKDGSFMKVTEVIPQPESLRFAGWRLYRTTDNQCDTFLPKLRNELVWLTQKDGLMSSDNIKRIVNIRFTNYRVPLRENPPMLTCRLKLTMRQAGVIIVWSRAPITADDNAIEYLEYHDADPGFRKWSNELRAEWRGETVPFGEEEKSTMASENERKGIIELEPERTYSFGDAYCGGGGVSCGAKQAGVKIKWATDRDQHALATYELNFQDVEIERADFYDFLTNSPDFLRVDIAHCSPPCQTWSPAHTVQSKNDDANSACVFSGVDLARATKCRILTIEETSGLVNRHVLVFNRIVLSLLELGYAVRWSILSCDHYGVPQERKRVMVIAAGPGEVLPHYPDPTHGDPGYGSNLSRRENIRTTIGQIPEDADDHNLARVITRWQNSHRESFSADSLARTITCGGGEFNYHPSGTRAYTDREMAMLQTFPMDYQFSGKCTRKQIGNAVPPRFAEAVYGEVIRSLRETDKEEIEGKFK